MESSSKSTTEVILLGRDGEEISALCHVQHWTPRAAFWEGMRKAGKIAGILFLLPIPLAVIEPFLFMIWGGVYYAVLILVIGPMLHWKFFTERLTFSKVIGSCPKCGASGELTPSLSSEYRFPLRVHCSQCGQVGTVLRETN